MSDAKPPVAALLLSGGESTRLGGEPKALLSVGGVPALARMVRIVGERGVGPVAIVVPPASPRVEAFARALAANVVRSERSRLGRTASIQEGLAVLPDEADVLLWPVDHSFVQGRTVDALLRARENDRIGRWFIPKWHGHGGHPVLLGRDVLPRVRRIGPDAPLRSLLEAMGPQVVTVPVEDEAVAHPIDTWEAYHEAARRSRLSPEGPWIGA